MDADRGAAEGDGDAVDRRGGEVPRAADGRGILVSRKRTYYHCTEADRGDEWRCDLLAPSRSPKEPPTPRLCVCPTVAGCFAARLFRPVAVHVYAVHCRGVRPPKSVWDRDVTGERWVVHRAVLRRERTVPAYQVARIVGLIREYHLLTRQKSTLKLRVAQYAIAAAVLGDDERWARKMCRIVGVDDPELFVIAKAVAEA